MDTTRIKATIEELLEKASVDFNEVEICDDEIMMCKRFVVRGGDSSLLIGRDGENLLALSHIIKRIVLKDVVDESPNSRENKFYIDVEDYNQKKIKRIKNTSLMMADRAKTFKRDVEMEPMSSYERMVVHSVLTNSNSVSTESEGMGKFRHVVIKYID